MCLFASIQDGCWTVYVELTHRHLAALGCWSLLILSEYFYASTHVRCVEPPAQSRVWLIRVGDLLCPLNPRGYPGAPEATLNQWWTSVSGEPVVDTPTLLSFSWDDSEA